MLIDIAHASTEEATATTEHATEAPADSGVLASLGINGQLFLFQLVNFAIVMVVLWFLILKPITKKMAERQKMIDDSIDNAKKIEETLRRGERSYQEKIDGAKVDANKIIEKAGVEAGLVAEDMKDKAKKEIEGLVEKAKANVKSEKEAMVRELKSETAEFIVMALEKILGETMDKQKDKKIVEEMLEKIKNKE